MTRTLQGFMHVVKQKGFWVYAVFVLLFGWAALKRFQTDWAVMNESPDLILNPLAVNASGCSIPELDPFDSDVLPFWRKEELHCHPVQKFAKMTANGQILVEKGHECSYKCVGQKNDFENDESSDWIKIDPKNPPSPRCDVVKIKCGSNFREIALYDIYPGASVKHEILDSSPDNLSAILLMLDGVSASSVVRNMPKSLEYLKDKMGAFLFKKHLRVGENTLPNLAAMIAGLRLYKHGDLLPDWPPEKIPKINDSVDHIDYIWKRYAKRGYVTSYFEDFAEFGTFNYMVGGFKSPPTDHYFRQFALAQKIGPYVNCIDGEFILNKTISIPDNLLAKYSGKRVFSLSIFNCPQHDSHDLTHLVDGAILHFLRKNFESGRLNNTALFLFSDHGARTGGVRSTTTGFIEVQLPFFSAFFPRSFLDKYPAFRANLATNIDRLTSHFDLYATLLHLLNLTEEQFVEPSKRGISFLSKIPEDRTCRSAGIPNSICLCNKRSAVRLQPSEYRKIAESLVEIVNQKAASLPNCTVHKLAKVVSAHKVDNNVRLVFETTASGAKYEVLVDRSGKPTTPIDRINEYGPTSKCVEAKELRPYCVCPES